MLKQDLRSADDVMRLCCMGASFPTALSFMRQMVRRMGVEKWQFSTPVIDLDENGYGTVVNMVDTGQNIYSLVSFSDYLAPDKRTDRVIAEQWDATFSLYDGAIDADNIARLKKNTPYQEAGRFTSKELVLARANKSLRLFSHVVDSLTNGQQPDIAMISSVGYLFRTSAVYGSGKFGCLDRKFLQSRDECKVSFLIEMIAVFLIREYSFLLVEHIAKAKGKGKAVALDENIKRYMGIGNSTGLGMAPFLVNHPRLVHQWVNAREQALQRVRNIKEISTEEKAILQKIATRLIPHTQQWQVDDETQMHNIQLLRREAPLLKDFIENILSEKTDYIIDKIYQYANKNFSLEGRELTTAMLLEPFVARLDDLCDTMYDDRGEKSPNPLMTVANMRHLIATHYQWALQLRHPQAPSKIDDTHFWYYSEDKIEPRFGKRHQEQGSDMEMPIAIARDVINLHDALGALDDNTYIGDYLLSHPENYRTVKRIQNLYSLDYAEIHDNVIGEHTHPIDILRFKLAFFGASKFDPKSNLWTRVNLFQGAPLAADIMGAMAVECLDDWAFPCQPS